jgi:D-alanyl-D-alanine carboxypeptidase
LLAQASGQPAFPLKPVRQGVFKFDPAGLQVEFEAGKPGFTLKQGGGSFAFTKE